MVSLDQVKASNSRVATALPAGLVAVFAGATSGIGERALIGFAKCAASPKIYFIGRSQESGDRIKSELTKLNPSGQYIFISSDLSLLRKVDEVSDMIKAQEQHVDLLYMTQGTLRQTTTSEGLPYHISLSLHSRLRLAQNLLPLLQRGKSIRRVITVFAGTKEGEFFPDDIVASKVSFAKARGHMCTCITLALEGMAKQAPEVSFIHNYPGAVRTNLVRKEDGFMLQLVRIGFMIFFRNKWLSDDEVELRNAWLCTSGMYPSQEGRGQEGVALEGGLAVADGSNGRKGSGVYSIDDLGSSAPKSVMDILAGYRNDGMVERIWQYLNKDFERICRKG